MFIEIYSLLGETQSALTRMFNDITDGQISPDQFSILSHIGGLEDKCSITQSDLSRKFAKDKGNISRIVRRMLSKNLLARDSKSPRGLVLTEAGHALLKNVNELLSQNYVAVAGVFGGSDEKTLQTILLETLSRARSK